MTDDGELANILTHPRFGVDKTYRALIAGRLAGDDMKRFIAGINLEDGKSAPAKVRVIRTHPAATEIDITIHEGRNRQVRRMFEATDHPVLALERLRFGPLSLGDMRQGQWRELTDKEMSALEALKRAAAEQDEA
jgi:pseudouridine synthase